MSSLICLPKSGPRTENGKLKKMLADRMLEIEVLKEVNATARFTLLKDATAEQLGKVRLELNGYALRWEELDEDIRVPGVVAGNFQVVG